MQLGGTNQLKMSVAGDSGMRVAGWIHSRIVPEVVLKGRGRVYNGFIRHGFLALKMKFATKVARPFFLTLFSRFCR